MDVVCTDKTGTLTEPALRVAGLVPPLEIDEATLAQAMASYAASAPLSQSDSAGDQDAPWRSTRRPRRRAGALLVAPALECARLGRLAPGTGAPERFVVVDPALVERARGEASAGRRVLALGRFTSPLTAGDPEPRFPVDVEALGLVLLAERLRPNAAETVAFFAAQDVELMVLSGDAPATVGAIARDAGVPGSAPALDGEALPSSRALREAVLSAPAVGRIAPEGKRAVVEALDEAGRYVAMVGDGVNDVPALKQARLAIAQGSGTQMARSVADLVLVRNDLGVVPGMVAEGRQILRNIQRVAQLFVTKSVFVAVVGRRRFHRQLPAPSATVHAAPGHDRHLAFVLALARSHGPVAPGAPGAGRASRFRPGLRSESGSSSATSSRATASTSISPGRARSLRASSSCAGSQS